MTSNSTSSNQAPERIVTHQGSCHCGAVRFEVDAPVDLMVHECNCSICRRSAYLHLIVPATHFRLLSGTAALSVYRFNTGIARHRFCRICGIKAFYVPRSNPDGYSINLRCLDPATLGRITIEPFDGRNWESSAAALTSLTAQTPEA
jgi:hypothetical protein